MGRIIEAACRLLSAFAMAAPAGASLPQELERCRAVADPSERLRCYDAIGSVAAGGTRPAGEQATPRVAEPVAAVPAADAGSPPSPEKLFGIDAARSEEALRAAAGVGRLDELELRVANVRIDAEGKPVFEFENGQAWRQLDSPAARLQPGAVVRIRRAAFGSYVLLRPDGSRAIRVRRIG
jgi:hypothetical protein